MDMTDHTRPTEEYPEPPDDAFPQPEPPVAVPAAVVASTMQTLNLLDEFFRRHASTATRAELRVFAGRQGWDPIQGAEVLIEGIGLDALSLGWARDATRAIPDDDTAQPCIMDRSSGDATADRERRPATSTRNRPRP
jgi:hypothetical protein